MTEKSLFTQVVRYLESRDDVFHIYPSPIPNSEIMVIQMRRVVRFQTINSEGFNPVDMKTLYYAPGVLLLDTRVKEKLSNKHIELRDWAKLLGMDFVPVRGLPDVLAALWPMESWTRDTARPDKIRAW